MIYFIIFSFAYFFNCNLCLIWLLQFFFIKHPNFFFTVNVFYCIRSLYSNFIFFVWSVIFGKNVFIFWYSYMITNFKFRIFITTLKSIYVLDFTSKAFISTVLWYALLHSVTISSNLSIYTFLDIAVIYL